MPSDLDRRSKFIEAYARTGKGAESAIEAGYSVKAARQQAARMLTKDDVLEAIRLKKEAINSEFDVKVVQVLRETSQIAFSDIRKCFAPDGKAKPIQEIDDATASAIQSYKVKAYTKGTGAKETRVEEVEFRLWNKNDALAKLGAHLDLFQQAPLPLETVEALLALLPTKLASDIRLTIAFPHGLPGAGQAQVAGAPGTGGAPAADGEGPGRLPG